MSQEAATVGKTNTYHIERVVMKKVIIAILFLTSGLGSKAYALDAVQNPIKATLPTPTLPPLATLTTPTLPTVVLPGSTGTASAIAVPSQSLVVPALTVPTLPPVATLTLPTLPPLATLTLPTLPKVVLPGSTSVTGVTAENSDASTATSVAPVLVAPVLVAPVLVMPPLPELVVPTLPTLPTPATVPATQTKTRPSQKPAAQSPSISVATPQELLDILNADSAAPELVVPQNAERSSKDPVRYLPYGAAGLSAYLGYRLLRKPKTSV